jgi:hypothetical protein
MGFAPTAEIEHTILQILAYSQENLTAVTTYIDNVRFVHRDPQCVSAAADTFLKNCAYVGASVNVEDTNELHDEGIFLGVYTNYATGCVSLAQKTIDKLRTAQHTLLRQDTTIAQMFEIFGVLFFASTVLKFRLDTVYHVFKFYRRRSSAFAKGSLSLESRANVWPCLRQDFDHWFESLLQNIPVDHNITLDGPETLFTDASKKGWGVVIFTLGGDVLTSGGSWSALEASRTINELEALALECGLKRYADVLHDKDLDIWIDNTSVLYAVEKGYSPSFHLNTRVRAVLDQIGRRKFNIGYIASASNPADEPSRRTYPTASPCRGDGESFTPNRERYSHNTIELPTISLN